MESDNLLTSIGYFSLAWYPSKVGVTTPSIEGEAATVIKCAISFREGHPLKEPPCAWNLMHISSCADRNQRLLQSFKNGLDFSTWDKSSTNLRQSDLSKTVNISIFVAIFLKESHSDKGIDNVESKTSTESSLLEQNHKVPHGAEEFEKDL
jgi:hypothetical protein